MNGSFTVSVRAVGAVICSVAGVLLLALGTFAGVESARSWGLALAVAAAVLWVWVIQARSHEQVVERVQLMLLMRER